MAGGTCGELGHIVTLNVRGTCLNSRSSPGACSALSVGAFLRMPPALLCLNSSVQAPQAAEGHREGTAEKSRERAAEKPRRREQRWTRAARSGGAPPASARVCVRVRSLAASFAA